MKLQVKIFIVLILLLVASLLVIIDKFRSKVNTEKISNLKNIRKFSMKVNEPTKEQITKIVQNIGTDNKDVQKENNVEKNTNTYIPTEQEDNETNEGYSKSKSENTYTVQSGDTFYYISKKFYQTSKYANKLFEYNKDIVKKPENLQIGMQLKIPDRTVLEKKNEIARK